jgi:hypothetical protein
MPSVFFSVKYKARAIAKERSARRIGNEIFGASVEALREAPKQRSERRMQDLSKTERGWMLIRKGTPPGSPNKLT